jgi:hypothetical protein
MATSDPNWGYAGSSKTYGLPEGWDYTRPVIVGGIIMGSAPIIGWNNYGESGDVIERPELVGMDREVLRERGYNV